MLNTRTSWVGLTIILVAASPLAGAAQQQGPVNVPRPECQEAIHEGPSGRQSAGFRSVDPILGLVPAGFEWFASIARGIGSMFRPGAIDPKYLGFQSGQQVGYDFIGAVGFKSGASRLFPGYKGIGGRNVTDVAKRGVPGRRCPGDPFWVAFPRPGNVENPPPFQFFFDQWDCFCRYDERVACPTGLPPPLGRPIFRPGPNLHRIYGGIADFIPCNQCFGDHNIRKHDYLVGTRKGPHIGYPAMAGDTGYQECLRQSIESFAASGGGGPAPGEEQVHGL